MGLESKKFKVKGCDTLYTLGALTDGSYTMYWTNSGCEPRKDTRRAEFVRGQFDSGEWYYVNPIGNSLADVVETKPDAVNSPKHYAVFDDIEAIEIIARSMSKEMFKGFCFGNLLKYRLRAGSKDELQQEISKANKYKELFEKYKDICQ